MKRFVTIPHYGLIGIALILMIFHFAAYTVYAVNLASFPFDYDQGEGFELYDTVLLSQFQSPYRDNEVYPFYASNYPPLYHVVLVPFVWLFGPAYWYGRLLGFGSTLVTAWVIGYIVHRGTKQRPAAILAGLAYLASNYIYHIGPLFRQHISMILFETLAILAVAIACEASDSGGVNPPLNRRAVMIGIGILLAAGFTKQLAIFTAVGFFMFLFLRAPRRAIVYGLAGAGVGGALFLGINLITGGQWWVNIITANVNGFIASQLFGLTQQFLTLHGALFVVAVGYALYELYCTRLSAYTVWFVASAGTAILSGKWGAGDSYFATMIAAMCVLAGLAAGKLWGARPEPLPVWRTVAGLVVAGLFVVYGLSVVKIPLDVPGFRELARALNIGSNTAFPNFYDSAKWTVGYAKLGQTPTEADVKAGWRIVEYAAADPARPILSEEAAFSFLSKKPVVTNPTQLLNLYNNGAYNPAGLVTLIEQKKFSVVIFRARFYPPPVLEAVNAHYQRVETIRMNDYDYEILLPNP
jgi:hypothetical protein